MTSAANAICIAHGDDPDGLICAAYLALLRTASTTLVNYDELEATLRRIRPPLKETYICDLNIRDTLCQEIVRIGEFAKVTIVDHHPTTPETLENLQKAGVTLIHNTHDCASVLLSDHFRKELSHEKLRLAAYAAISDQFEDGPLATELLVKFDKQLMQHEALILTHALAKEHSIPFKLKIVEELKTLAFPHNIEGVTQAALSYLELATGIVTRLPKEARKLHRLAYAEAQDQTSTGTMANLLLDALDMEVGVSFKSAAAGILNISVRGRRGSTPHLGEITRRLAEKCGGFGGGHMRASGASIPSAKLQEFLTSLEEELGQSEET